MSNMSRETCSGHLRHESSKWSRLSRIEVSRVWHQRAPSSSALTRHLVLEALEAWKMPTRQGKGWTALLTCAVPN